MDAHRFRITYFDPDATGEVHTIEHRCPDGRLGYRSRAEAESWIAYMKLCDPWRNVPALAATLQVVEGE